MVVSTVPKFRAFMPGVLSAIAKLGRVGLAAALKKQTLEPKKFSDVCYRVQSCRVLALFDVIARLPMPEIELLAPRIPRGSRGVQRHTKMRCTS